MNIEINIYSTRKRFKECVRRGNCPLSKLKICKEYKLIAFLETLEQKWKISPTLGPGKQTDWVWFGEIERKLAKLSMPTFTFRSSS
jgi:hypothetical protein